MGFEVYLITDRRRLPAGTSLPEALARTLSGVEPGRVAVQLREKDLDEESLCRLGHDVVAVCRAAGAPLFLNGPDRVAAAIGADGVHLGEAQHGRLGQHHGRAGVSVHDLAGVERARAADFLVIAPVFPTPGKAEPGQELGLAGLGRLIGAARDRGIDAPIYALGGVIAARVQACRAVGARGVAVIGAVWSPSPRDLAAPLSPVTALRGLLSAFVVESSPVPR